MSEQRDKDQAARAAYEQQFGRKAPETWKSALPRDWHRRRGQATPLNVPLPHADPEYDRFIIKKFVPQTERKERGA